MNGSDSKSWAGGISAITLFVDDLAATSQFYQDVFDLPIHYQDDESVVFRFGGTLVNLLVSAAAGELIEPGLVAPTDQGSRLQLTINVDDVHGESSTQSPGRS